MASIVHFRHAKALDQIEHALQKVPDELKYIVIVYDGAQVPKAHRMCSYKSNAVQADVEAVCNSLAKQSHA